MKIAVQFTKNEELKALPIILRHSSGLILRDRTYVLYEDVLKLLRDAGVKYRELGREGAITDLEGAASGKRI